MTLIERLREQSQMKAGEAWSRQDGGQDLCIGSALAEEAADEIERLRATLKPFADLAALYETAHEKRLQIWKDEVHKAPLPDSDSHRVSIGLGECRRALDALGGNEQITTGESDDRN